jgi:hypothetical protein
VHEAHGASSLEKQTMRMKAIFWMFLMRCLRGRALDLLHMYWCGYATLAVALSRTIRFMRIPKVTTALGMRMHAG